jgi:four helix bundle protein
MTEDSPLVTDFRSLRVYRTAFDTAMLVRQLSRSWPPSERFALTDQVIRSSRAVCSSVAEAWYQRRYPKHFVSKISEATSEAAETLVWIDFAVACGYLEAGLAGRIQNDVHAVIGGLIRMSRDAGRWCGPAATSRGAPHRASGNHGE